MYLKTSLVMATKNEKEAFAREVKAKAKELIALIESGASNPKWDEATFNKWEDRQGYAKVCIERGIEKFMEGNSL